MTRPWLPGLLIACILSVAWPASAPAATDPIDPTLGDGAAIFRVFLTDGQSLVSYGELARVADRVVFSMPISAAEKNPPLHLINISADHVDWDRTNRYSESVRAARYMATMAESHYAMLTAEIAQALNDVAATTDPGRRLEIVERARKTLADWPGEHFNYKADEIAEMVGVLDEAIADLRAAAGVGRFDLALVATSRAAPDREPLLPRPTAREAIEQALTAASLADSPAERVSLMAVALTSMDRDADILPGEWRTETRAKTRAAVAVEIEADRAYQSLTSRMMMMATTRARAADVRGVERVLTRIRAQDQLLGERRPDAVNGLIAAVEAELDAARRLRLERDRWALREPELRKYRAAIDRPLGSLLRIETLLEDIKALAGSGPDALGAILRTARDVVAALTALTPPAEVEAPHSLLVSAAHLALSAAEIRREAALHGSIPRAWDASAAAAGALMLTERGQGEIEAALKRPDLAR